MCVFALVSVCSMHLADKQLLQPVWTYKMSVGARLLMGHQKWKEEEKGWIVIEKGWKDELKAEWDIVRVKDRRDEVLVLANMYAVIRTTYIIV